MEEKLTWHKPEVQKLTVNIDTSIAPNSPVQTNFDSG